MRLCKGDGHALQLECCQQRGGHYYCSGCAIHADMTYELDHAFRCPTVTLIERQKLILQGTIGKMRSLVLNPNPYQNLSKAELE
jgi:hypothetical protein